MANDDNLNTVEDFLVRALEEIRRRRMEQPGAALSVPNETVRPADMPSNSPIQSEIAVLDQSPTTPARPRSCVGEMRRLFSPYPTSADRRGNSHREPMSRGGGNFIQPILCCLADPNSKVAPTGEMKEQLKTIGLGPVVVKISKDTACSEVEDLVRRTFPRLEQIEFKLMTVSALSRKKYLVPICTEGIPSGAYLHQRRLSTIYVKPGISLLEPVAGAVLSKEIQFFCLESPLEMCTPSRERETELQNRGLGLACVSLERGSSSKVVEARIREKFPLLGTAHYQIMKKGRCGYNVPLNALSTGCDIPEANLLLASRNSVLYIRPLENLRMSGTVQTSGDQLLSTDNWMRQKFICLGNPNERTVPTSSRLTELNDLGLGETNMMIEASAESSDIEAGLRASYPRLEEVPFQLLKPLSGSSVSLTGLSYFDPVPDGSYISQAGIPVIFVRPFRDVDRNVGETAAVSASTSSILIQEQIDQEICLRALQDSVGETPSNTTQEVSIIERGSGIPVELGDVLELSEFRNAQKQKFPRQTQDIIVERGDLDDLLSIYKDPNFKVEKQTNIKFVGEPGRDLGAVTKEFFNTSMNLLISKPYLGKHPFFVGQKDHLLPNVNPLLLSAGHFRFLGKFIAHSILQTGVGFIGLNPSAVKYLFKNHDLFSTSFTLSTEDIPDYDRRQAFTSFAAIQAGQNVSPESLQTLQEFLADAGIYEIVSRSNAHLLMEQFACHAVFYSRAASFEAIREGMKETEVFDFLKCREYLWSGVFPRTFEIAVLPEDIIRNIRYEGEARPEIKEILENFVTSLDKTQLQNLLQCWTGWPSLPEEGLEVKIKTPGIFIFHSCFNQLEIPTDISTKTFEENLRNSLAYGYLGFGSA